MAPDYRCWVLAILPAKRCVSGGGRGVGPPGGPASAAWRRQTGNTGVLLTLAVFILFFTVLGCGQGRARSDRGCICGGPGAG